jgi:hypothetical protein
LCWCYSDRRMILAVVLSSTLDLKAIWFREALLRAAESYSSAQEIPTLPLRNASAACCCEYQT